MISWLFQVAIGYYFDGKRALASGIARIGAGIGMFAFPPLATYLLATFDWKVTFFAVAGLCILCSLIGGLMRPLEPPTKNDLYSLYLKSLKLSAYKSEKRNNTFSRKKIFNHRFIQKFTTANKFTPSWENFWHLLIAEQR